MCACMPTVQKIFPLAESFMLSLPLCLSLSLSPSLSPSLPLALALALALAVSSMTRFSQRFRRCKAPFGAYGARLRHTGPVWYILGPFGTYWARLRAARSALLRLRRLDSTRFCSNPKSESTAIQRERFRAAIPPSTDAAARRSDPVLRVPDPDHD